MTTTPLPSSPAAERNKAPILEVLRQLLPASATVLEIASGTGQHAEHFAAAEAGWQWQPTDEDEQMLPAIAARCAGLPQVRPPVRLDVLDATWPAALGRFDAIFCANMLHISPWATCAALMQGAARHLVEGGGLLVVYGPFIVEGTPTAASNLSFNTSLKARDPAWGLRRLEQVQAEAQSAGLTLQKRFDMPANNLMLAFGRLA
jgi:SAM-dependent methyltransferase